MIACAVVVCEALLVGSGRPSRAVAPLARQSGPPRMQIMPDEPDHTFSSPEEHRQRQRAIMAAARLQILQKQIAEGVEDPNEPFDVKMRCESRPPVRI